MRGSHSSMARKARIPRAPMQAIGYVRVSTDDQALSVDAQRARITAWCVERRLSLSAVYEDIGVSGGAALDKRPGLMAAIDALEPGVVLVAVKRDRLARDTMNAAMIERLAERVGAKVLTCDGAGEGDSPEARLMRTMIDAFAEYERQIIAARTKAALGVKRAKGEKLGGRVPYGSQLAADGTTLEPHGAEQAVITLARELHAMGLSSRQVAARLAERGLYSRVGTVFTSSAILAMVAAYAYNTCITGIARRGEHMADRQIDPEVEHSVDAKIDRVLEAYPELCAVNPERQQAWEVWLEGLEQGEAHHGK
jgi:site-specific DNA recombinase